MRAAEVLCRLFDLACAAKLTTNSSKPVQFVPRTPRFAFAFAAHTSARTCAAILAITCHTDDDQMQYTALLVLTGRRLLGLGSAGLVQTPKSNLNRRKCIPAANCTPAQRLFSSF
eukprot:1812325-Rhodomonas_salina.1